MSNLGAGLYNGLHEQERRLLDSARMARGVRSRRPLAVRWKYAFVKTYKPVMDDAPYRVFDTMAEYRKWCEENLSDWLGYSQIRK
jgi:hypothetical protein